MRPSITGGFWEGGGVPVCLGLAKLEATLASKTVQLLGARIFTDIRVWSVVFRKLASSSECHLHVSTLSTRTAATSFVRIRSPT